MGNPRSSIYEDRLTASQALEVVAGLNSLMSHPSWKVWEKGIREARDAHLESLAQAAPDKVQWFQGYVAALGAILRGPEDALAIAAEAEEQLRREDKTPTLRLVPDYGDDMPVV